MRRRGRVETGDFEDAGYRPVIIRNVSTGSAVVDYDRGEVAHAECKSQRSRRITREIGSFVEFHNACSGLNACDDGGGFVERTRTDVEGNGGACGYKSDWCQRELERAGE